MATECIIAPTAEHTHTVILLHGRGSNAPDFRIDFFICMCSNGQMLPERFPMIKWVLPSAPKRYSTVFRGKITEWFDIHSLDDPESRQDLQVQGLAESVSQIRSIMDRELELVPPENLFLGGISQGCATAIHTLWSQGNTLAGFIGISGWLPFASTLDYVVSTGSNSKEKNQELVKFYTELFSVLEPGMKPKIELATSENKASATPAFLCHGADDVVVMVLQGYRLRDAMAALGMSVTWKEDGACGHWIKAPQAVDALAQFLSERL